MDATRLVLLALAGRDIRQEASFSVPYTALVEDGRVREAYKVVTVTETTKKKLPNGEVRTKTVTKCFLRKEYDLTQHVVYMGLDVEADELNQLDRFSSAVKTMFVERFTKLYTYDPTVYLTSMFLNAQQSHNLLERGDENENPLAEKDTAEALEQVMRERKFSQSRVHGNHREKQLRSGLLQQFVEAVGGQNEVIRATWSRDVSSDDQGTVTLLALRNVYGFKSKKFAFERSATFEGPRALVDQIDLDSDIRHLTTHVTFYITKALLSQSTNKFLSNATLYFKRGADRHFYFLFAHHLHFHDHSSPAVMMMPKFKVPSSYNVSLGLPRPANSNIQEEDMVDTSSLRIDQVGGSGGAAAAGSTSMSPERGASRRRKWRFQDGSGMDGDAAEDEWLLSKVVKSCVTDDDRNANEDDLDGEPAHSFKGKQHDGAHRSTATSTTTRRRKKGELADTSLPTYEELIEAIGGSFPAPVPVHDQRAMTSHDVRTTTGGQQHKLMSKDRAHTPSTSQQGVSKSMVQRSPVMIPNIAPSQDALERRKEVAVVASAKSLLAVLEGRRPLDNTLVNYFNLGRKEQGYLKEGYRGTKAKTQEEFRTHGEEKPTKTTTKGSKSFNKEPARMMHSRQGHTDHGREETSDFNLSTKPDSWLFNPHLHRAGSEHDSIKQTIKPLVRRSKGHDELKSSPIKRWPGAQPHGKRKLLREAMLQRQCRKMDAPTGGTAGGDRAPGGTGDSVRGGQSDEETGSGPYNANLSPSQSSLQSKAQTLDGFPELANFFSKAPGSGTQADDDDQTLESVLPGESHHGRTTPADIAQRYVKQLEEFDRQLTQRLSGREIDPDKNIDYLLSEPVPYTVIELPHLANKLEHQIKPAIMRTCEYLNGLCYLFASNSLTKRTRKAIETGGGKGSGDKYVLLFSIPHSVGFMEKKLVSFLKHLPYFEQMNTEENISELQLMLMSSSRAAAGHHQHQQQQQQQPPQSTTSSGTIQAVSLPDDIYATHAVEGANIIAIPTFAVTAEPAKLQLQAKCNKFILDTLRLSYLERVDELNEEASMKKEA